MLKHPLPLEPHYRTPSMIIYSSKYYTKYNQICKHYKELDLKKSKDLYTEKHHILPKSMGGTNKKDNLVRVPARVHFLMHWMLYRIYRTTEMVYGWNMMCSNRSGQRFISKSFEYARILAGHERKGKPSWNKGISHSDETKIKISEKKKGSLLSDETKAKISESLKGNAHAKGIKHTDETKAKWSDLKKGNNNARFGKPHSDETKAKISATKKLTARLICPHCNKIGNISNMKRWHFTNCKFINKYNYLNGGHR
jgi:hypothetical protein